MSTKTFVRTVEVEREKASELGSFPLTLATDGEASDGHILNIKGGTIPRKMPLLFGHDSSPKIPLLGSIVEARKLDHALKAQGRINMNGDDPLADVRRGIAQLVHDGDLGAVSVRWDASPEHAVSRSELPASHPAYVGPGEKDHRKQYGMYFKKWNALEGSIVAIGADPKALIGRADASTDEHMKVFFRSLAHEAEQHPEGMADLEVAFAALQEAVNGLRGQGVSEVADIFNAISSDGFVGGEPDLVEVHFGEGRRLWIPRECYDQLRGESIDYYREALRLHTVDVDEFDFDSLQRSEPENDAGAEEDTSSVEALPADGQARPDPTPVGPRSEDIAREVTTMLKNEMRNLISDEVDTLLGKVKS